MPPSDPQQSLLDQAVAHHQSGRFAEAEQLYRQVLGRNPDHPDALHLFGLLAKQADRPDIALPLVQRATIIKPAEAIYHNSLGTILIDLRRVNEAVQAYARAIELDPDYAHAIMNMGAALASLGRHEDAIRYYHHALKVDPKHDLALTNLGNSLDALDRLDEALAAHMRSAVLAPQNADAHNNAAMALTQLGRAEEALPLFRRAMSLRPGWAAAHSNLLLALHYAHGDQGQRLAAEHRAFAEAFERNVPHAIRYPHDRSPERRLRVAYCSGDLYRHPVADFLLPLLEHHDRERYEVLVYSDTRRPDATMAQLKHHVDRWLDTAAFNDDQFAVRVTEDRVDLLIDLAGHTANNRLLAFARRPAPVQLTYLGYPNTTGLSSIHHRLTDAVADPDGTDALHAERLLRLDGCFLCYRPPADAPPPERTIRGHVTFGSFNNFAKVTDAMLRTWAGILRRVPDSCLLLKARALASPSARERVVKIMATDGIDEDRLTLLAQDPSHRRHLELYRDVDVALDTYPYNGTTTTCEALWMGVPVVTLAGPTHVTRVSASILTATGHSDWVAASEADYIDAAARLAQALPNRPVVRASIANSRLRDELAFTRRFETALRTMWSGWLNSA